MLAPGSKVVVRTRADASYGFGHLVRAAALAREIAAVEKGVDLEVWLEGSEEAFRQMKSALPGGVRLEAVIGNEEELLQNANPAWVIFDLYEIPAALRKLYWARAGANFLVFNDSGFPLEGRGIFVHPQPLEKYPEAGKGQRCLNGPEYFVLRPEIREKTGVKKENRVFLGLGGGVSEENAEKLSGAMVLLKDSGLRCVCATGFTKGRGWEKAPQEFLLKDPAQALDALARSKIALLAGGFSKFEAAALGVPTLLTSVVDHQETLGRAFEQATGAGRFIGRLENLSSEAIAEAVKLCLEGASELARMEMAGPRAVSTGAAGRIIGALSSSN